MQVLIHDINRQINELHDGSLWFDQSIKDKIDNVSSVDAFIRPIPEIHSVAEHVSHMLAWRKECIRRFHGTKTELMDSPEDWKENAELVKIGWDMLKNELYKSRYELLHLLENRDDTFLKTKFQDSEYDFHYLIEGILQHDIYHLGQIGITLKLLKIKN